MSRVAHPSEKVLAVASIYSSLIDELHILPQGMPLAEVRQGAIFFNIPPAVTAALIEAATRLAMSTDTKSMGIMSPDAGRIVVGTLTPAPANSDMDEDHTFMPGTTAHTAHLCQTCGTDHGRKGWYPGEGEEGD